MLTDIIVRLGLYLAGRDWWFHHENRASLVFQSVVAIGKNFLVCRMEAGLTDHVWTLEELVGLIQG